MRVVFIDGEMSNLSADYGQLLCWCHCEYDPIKDRPGKLTTFTLHDYRGKRWDDLSLAKEITTALQQYDLIVSWNGIKFDLPFLNTRLQYWKQREAKVKRHKDLLYTARYKLRLSNNKLDTVARYLGCSVEKTSVDPARWTMALGGHYPSYQYIVDHCQRDVRVLGEVYSKLKDLMGEVK